VNVPLLDLFAQDELRRIVAASRRRKFRRNEIVFHDGDPGDTLHLVVKGQFAIRVTTPLGDVATLRIVGPGEHFGELAVLAPGPRAGTVVALEAAETLSLHRDDVNALRTTLPKIDEVLMTALVEEIRRQASALVDALYVPADRRVWRRLHELAARYGDRVPVVIPLTQDDVAQLAGTTRPTANRVLRTGEEQGVVVLGRGRIEVNDLDALARLAR
jgi:CRP-like cAMP-binding protein